MNLAALLHRSARCHPDRSAVTWRGRTIDYRTFDAQVRAVDGWLRSVGCGPDTRVAVCMDNRPEVLVVMFAVFRSGATLVPCNSRLTADELQFIIDDAEARVVFTDPAHEATVRAAAGSAFVCVAGDELDAVRSGPIIDDAPAEVSAESVAWLFYTSGTTGRPKGAMLSHGVLLFATVSWLADLTPLDEHDVTLHAAPLSHGAGFHALAVTARAAHHVITPEASFDPVGLVDLVRDHGVTNTWLVPTQIVLLVDAVEPGIDLPTLQRVVYGGAPMTEAATRRALERFGPIFVQLYGQGESPMTITMLRREDHLDDELLGTAGRARPGVELAVVDETDRPVGPDEVGEVVVRGPSVMSGYWHRPEATAETLRNGWLHTGDLGTLSDGGVLRLLDRTKDMIISGGSNVYAVEVEAVISAHPDVADVAVIGLPDDTWGELVVAVVVPRDGTSLDEAGLDAHCRTTLAGYKMPRRWVPADALPRNAYGKVLKRELRTSLGAG